MEILDDYTNTKLGVDNEDGILDSKDIEALLFEISSDEFVINEIEKQIEENIFNTHKTNYVQVYMDKYKLIKNSIGDMDDSEEENLQKLKNNKNIFMDFIIDKLSEEFEVDYDKNNIKAKHVKALYGFLILDYVDNLSNFFINYIQTNKKEIIKTLKSIKVKRDISSSANKIKYFNAQDALILNNIDFIIDNIICGTEFENKEFMDLLVYQDDYINNNIVANLVDEGKVLLGDNFANSFMSPYIEERAGFSIIISNVVCTLSSLARKNDISDLIVGGNK